MPEYGGPTLAVPYLGLIMRPVMYGDAVQVCGWRNSDEAQEAFFTTGITTPDHHAAFIENRKPHDFTWMFEMEGPVVWEVRSGPPPVYGPAGMAALTVRPETRDAEAGRLFVDQRFRKPRYSFGIPLALCWYAFDVLRLDHVWCDILSSNKTAMKLNRMIGYSGCGVDVPGHTHPKGPVTHMERWRKDWQGLGYWVEKLGLSK